MVVFSTSSCVSVLMLDEWGGCGFPPARPSWLTDLWMTLSPPLSLRSHTPQQCHICPAAQSATIWNGFVLRTPKWLQITWNLMSLRMLSLIPSLAAAASVAIVSDHFKVVPSDRFSPQPLLFAFFFFFAGRAAWMWSCSLQYGPDAGQLHGCSAQKNDDSAWPRTTAERGPGPWSPEPHDPPIWNELSTPG